MTVRWALLLLLPACEISTFEPYDLRGVNYDLELTNFASSAGTVAPGFPLRVHTQWSICGGVGQDEEWSDPFDTACLDTTRAVAYQCVGVTCRIIASDGTACDRKIEWEKPGAWYACTPAVTVMPEGEGAFHVEATPLSTEFEDREEMGDVFQTVPVIVDGPDALSIESCRPTAWDSCTWLNQAGEAAVLFHVRAAVGATPVALYPSSRTELAFPLEVIPDVAVTSAAGGRVDCYPAWLSSDGPALDCLAEYDAEDVDEWTVPIEARYGGLVATGVAPYEATSTPTTFWCATHSCEYPQ